MRAPTRRICPQAPRRVICAPCRSAAGTGQATASPSSRGLGHRPFTAVTRVRISLGTPFKSNQWLSTARPSPAPVFATPIDGHGQLPASAAGRIYRVEADPEEPTYGYRTEPDASELVGIRQEHEFMHLFAAPPCAYPGCALPINGQEPGLSPPHITTATECAAIEHCCATTAFRIPNRFITND